MLVPNVHVQANDNGDYVISRDGHGEVTITPEHVITLANYLPGLAHQILQKLNGPGSSQVQAISGANVGKISFRHDLLSEKPLLQLTDTQGMEYAFLLSSGDAKRLIEELLEIAAKAEETGRQSKQ
jgi:hypothetical protein